MGDIVERLRGMVCYASTNSEWPNVLLEEAADEIERLREDLRIAQGNTDAAIDDYNRCLPVIEAARKVIRTHPMSHSRDEQIHKLLEAIAVYDKKNSDELQATTQCSAEAVIDAARRWCQETIAAKWSDWSTSIIRDDFAPRELALFDAIIAYDKENKQR